MGAQVDIRRLRYRFVQGYVEGEKQVFGPERLSGELHIRDNLTREFRNNNNSTTSAMGGILAGPCPVNVQPNTAAAPKEYESV